MLRQNFTAAISYEGKSLHAAIVPQFRKDGIYYEVNVKGFPRFFMTWTELDRYDATGDEKDSIPYELVLAISDIIENKQGKQ
ncbi:MAG: hypothetical protein EOP51_17010 [Sphingobacteriales bacterium]|nr:MAG: hypothetical protein EOP51_17010 [Sphingobacteriales bacterium]